MRELPQSEWPALLHEHYSVAGVFVGGCVDGRKSFRAKAHAHTTNEHRGWLCFRSEARLSDNALVIHELAHILTGEGHTNTWRQMVLNLGGTLDETEALRDYHARARRGNPKYSGERKPHLPSCPCAVPVMRG